MKRAAEQLDFVTAAQLRGKMLALDPIPAYSFRMTVDTLRVPPFVDARLRHCARRCPLFRLDGACLSAQLTKPKPLLLVMVWWPSIIFTIPV